MAKNKSFEEYANSLFGEEFGTNKTEEASAPWTVKNPKDYHPQPLDVIVVDKTKNKVFTSHKNAKHKPTVGKGIGNNGSKKSEMGDGPPRSLTPIVIDTSDPPFPEQRHKSSFWKRRKSLGKTNKSNNKTSTTDEIVFIDMGDNFKENNGVRPQKTKVSREKPKQVISGKNEKSSSFNFELKTFTQYYGESKTNKDKIIKNEIQKANARTSNQQHQSPHREDSGISLNEEIEDEVESYADEGGTKQTNILKSDLINQHSDAENDDDLAYFCVDHIQMCKSRNELRKHRTCHLGKTDSETNSPVILSNSSETHLQKANHFKENKAEDRYSTPLEKSDRSPARTTKHSARRMSGRISKSSSLGSRSSSRGSPSQMVFSGWRSLNMEMLQKLSNYAGVITEDRENVKKELKDRKTDMEEQIMDMVEDTIAHLLKLKKQGLAQLEALHSVNMERTDREIARLQKLRHEARLVLSSLEVPDDFADLDKYKEIIMTAAERALIFQEILQKSYNNTQHIEYDFEIKPEVSAIYELDEIASVHVKTGIPRLPPFLCAKKCDDDNETNSECDFTSLRNLEGFINVDGSGDKANGKCCFTGCAYIVSESVLLADWTNGVLKLINKFGLVADTLDFGESPWDVVQNYTGQAAVTVPKLQTIFFVEAEPHLRIVGKINTGHQCFGISKIGENYVITCDPCSRFPSVRILDESGRTLLVIQKDGIGENCFKCPMHVCVDFFNTMIYVSDSTDDCVYGFSLNGDVIFCYENNDLEYPAGLACDRNNCVYICGKTSSNIHKITNNGALVERFLQRRHGVNSPCAIAFHPDGDHMILTDVDGKMATGFWKMHIAE